MKLMSIVFTLVVATLVVVPALGESKWQRIDRTHTQRVSYPIDGTLVRGWLTITTRQFYSFDGTYLHNKGLRKYEFVSYDGAITGHASYPWNIRWTVGSGQDYQAGYTFNFFLDGVGLIDQRRYREMAVFDANGRLVVDKEWQS